MLDKKEIVQSMHVKGTPFDHQVKAYNFVCDLFGLNDGRLKSPGAALLMQMGTGKTLVAIAVMGRLFSEGLIRRTIVVAPLSALGVWKSEFEKFADFSYTITLLNGSSDKKKKQLDALTGTGLQVVLVNYESAWRIVHELLDIHAEMVVADESHKIKDTRTKQSEGLFRLGDQADYRLIMTGTAITNKEIDIFSQYRFCNQKIFGHSFYRFRSRYFNMTGYENHIPVFRPYLKDEFSERIHSIAFRVTKEECLDLPETTEEFRYVELERYARRVYEDMRYDCYCKLQESESEVTAKTVLTQLMRLQQITGGHITDDNGNVQSVSCAKLDALSDILDDCKAEDKKLVVIARFIPEIKDIMDLLDKKKIGYAKLYGEVKNRDEEIARFQNDSDCMVFVGQIATAGQSITLTAASTMVFYSLDFSMSNFEQAKARIHRAGQKENCQYIYLVADDTIDDSVINSLMRKQDLAHSLIDNYRKGNNPF